MTERTFLHACATLTASLLAFTSVAHAQADAPKRFPVASVRFEQNATDGDVEVVFEISGRSEGLTTLSVERPDGVVVVDFASDDSTAGIRQFVFESPEPKDVASIKASYPEGTYKFEGQTATGTVLRGEAKLSHQLPATTSFVAPKADARGVSVNDLKITWAPVQGMAGYIVEIESDEPEMSLTAKLPASEAAFSVPNGFLRPGTEYQLGIGTVASDGNISFVETNFTTAAE
jgi:hypothetical protein